MKVTRHTDYALRVLIYLAIAGDRPTTIAEVAGAYGISSHHLVKITQELARCGWIEQRRGRGGGMRLLVEPSRIVLGQVVRELECLDLVECFDLERDGCAISPACTLKRALREATDAWLAVLDRYTLADLARRRSRLAGLVGLAATGRAVAGRAGAPA
ncbi:MAG TPA: Rrf2 family transcriptional regulator [Thermoanaerobaculia bacterium]|nr:Rrf2 family transcriptional regulator [Thermoanaerobaculia bacterium]